MMNHRPMSKPQFRRALRFHQLWVETGGSQGDPASLQGVNIRALRKDLKGAILQSADLRCADLQYTNLQGADLQGADLRCADLRSANFQKADLRGADLNGAELEGTFFVNTDLRGAKFSVEFQNCFSFWYSKFTSDALPWLILHPMWPETNRTVKIDPLPP